MIRFTSFLLLVAVIFAVSCQNSRKMDNYDEIAAFKPDDKYFTAGLKTLHFIKETSPISKVDSVFSQMITHFDLPTNASGCADGTFTGESIPDAYDYVHWAKIKIEDEKIVWIDYNEIHKNGIGKEENEEYNKEMSAAGTSPSVAYPAMEKELLDEQELLSIDGVSGASYSVYRFRYAVIMALMKARIKAGSA